VTFQLVVQCLNQLANRQENKKVSGKFWGYYWKMRKVDFIFEFPCITSL